MWCDEVILFLHSIRIWFLLSSLSLFGADGGYDIRLLLLESSRIRVLVSGSDRILGSGSNVGQEDEPLFRTITPTATATNRSC
jgi:hypothetical protein